jgi:chaperone required for assembly of F1-ATPase
MFCTSTSTTTTTAVPPIAPPNILANSAASKLKKEGVKIGGVKGDGTSPRWYKKIDVHDAPPPTSSGTVDMNKDKAKKYYTVKMDTKRVNTPKENQLVVPSELLAKAIAVEWEAQDTHIKPTGLPLTRLATSALDLIPMYRAEIIDTLVNTLKTDTACCREVNRGDLHEKQDAAFRPIITWMGQRFGVAPKVSFAFGIINQPEPLLAVGSKGIFNKFG